MMIMYDDSAVWCWCILVIMMMVMYDDVWCMMIMVTVLMVMVYDDVWWCVVCDDGDGDDDGNV